MLTGLVDFDKERKRLENEKSKVSSDIQKLEKRLSNPGYLAKAAAEIVEKDKALFEELQDKLQRIDEQLADFS